MKAFIYIHTYIQSSRKRMRDSAIFRLDAISQGYRTSLPDYATYSKIQSRTLLLPAQLFTLFRLHFYSGDIFVKQSFALKEKTKAATSKTCRRYFP